MKVKILSLLLSVTLLFFAVIPAHAAETGDFDLINVLDYCTPDDTGEYLVFLNTGYNDVSFSGAPAFRAYDINLLCYITGTISGVKFISSGGVEFNLTYTKVAYNLYRITGYVQGYSIEDSKLRFSHSSNITVEFLSYYINPVYADVVPELGTFYLETHGYSPTIYYDPSDSINGRTWTANEDYRNAYLSVWGNVNNWHYYDYIDLQFSFACSGINSISVMFGNEVVPFESSVLFDAGLSITEHYITVRVDVRGLDRSSDNYPIIRIEANCSPGLENSFNVVSIAGIIDVESINSVSYWLLKLNLSFDQWFDVISHQLFDIRNYLKGDTQAADSFNDQAEQKNDQLQDMVGIMDSVSRPDINQLNPSLTIQNSGADIVGGIGPVLTVPMQNPIILQVLILSLTFAMIAYVLYGKR